MIVIDTSALMAVLLDEPLAPFCIEALCVQDLAMSAGTLAEVLIVAGQRRLKAEIDSFLAELSPEIVPVDEQFASAVAAAYSRWGKGNHPASLNYGDCFAYALAAKRGWPLLYVGQDFAKTDLASALSPG
ncbi:MULTISPECIES: type II toxin-antitoxin system VapC family toxin [unclassified Azospirillum]|uniref:type II toxin-antitoxin system VapC family toxin n=1 Tax=unclassified Azospirillum TaxID=2630922 RepID=UPI000B78507F|nr:MULTISPECIES: type II toxin-antitoxin system VapC family toxin [unclassified Azospirillum]